MESRNRERVLLWGVMPVIILAIAWFFFIQPKLDSYNDAKASLKALQTQTASIKDGYTPSQQEQADLATAFADQPDAAAVEAWVQSVVSQADGNVDAYEAVAGSSGLKVKLTATIPPDQTASVVQTLLTGIKRDDLLNLARRNGAGYAVSADEVRIAGGRAGRQQQLDLVLLLQSAGS